jgi:uncharacterized protein (DUF2141 family)
MKTVVVGPIRAAVGSIAPNPLDLCRNIKRQGISTLQRSTYLCVREVFLVFLGHSVWREGRAPERISAMTGVMTNRVRGALMAMGALTAMTVVTVVAAPARAALVEIAVTGVTEARGHVRVELCTKDTFLTSSCPYQGQAPATVGATVVKIAEVPPGEYAAQVFHDETDQGVVHQDLLGIPREKIGFSNDAPLHIQGPRFKDAAFMVGSELERITLKVRRLFGGH